MGFWRLAPFDRTVWIVVWSVRICWVIVSIVIGFIINIIAIGVTAAGRWRAIIGRFIVETAFIRAITVGPVGIWTFSIGTAGVGITVALTISVTIPPIFVRTVWPVIIRVIIGLRRTMMVLRSLRSFLEDGSNWFVLCEWDCDPAMIVVYARPLPRIHQRLLVGYHLVQLLQLPLLPRQLVIHNSSNTPGRRTQLPPPLVTFFALQADFAPLLADPVLAPAATPAGAFAAAATPAVALCAASRMPV